MSPVDLPIMIGLRVPSPPDPRSLYVFEWLFCVLGIPFEVLRDRATPPDDQLVIHYGVEPDGQEDRPVLSIPCIPFERQRLDAVASTYMVFQGKPLCLYGVCRTPTEGTPLMRYGSGEPAVTRSGGTIRLGFDIVASIFHLLSLKEAHKEVEGQALQQPVVDQYIDLLHFLIERCIQGQERPVVSKCLWPDGSRFALFLSHDVDAVHRREPFTIAVDLYRIVRAFVRGDVHKALRDARTLCHLLSTRDDIYWNFDRWMELEDQYHIRSSFYFLEGRRLSRYGRRYNAATLKPVIQRLIEGGWEVGLHGSYAAWREAKKLRSERSALENITEVGIQGHRQHYLHFDPEASYRCYEETGLEYDSTLGHNHQIGYRAGTSLPFHPYDAATERRLHLLEIPLMVMDKPFLMDGVPLHALDEMLTRTAANGGLFSLLWHQRSFAQKALYEQVVQYALQQHAWIATGAEINAWWRAREACTYTYQYHRKAHTLSITVRSAYPKGLCFKIRSLGEENGAVPCQPGRQTLHRMHIIMDMV